MSDLDVITSALQDGISMLSFRTWWRRPWLWVLALVAWLIPLASIVTPATLSVGTDMPLPVYKDVPNVEFSSLNLVAPMADYGTSGHRADGKTGINFMYGGPSLTVQRITDAVASQGLTLSVNAPSVNSTWNMEFSAPSLHCNPVDTDFREAVLDNVLNYTFTRSQHTMQSNCSYGPGYMAWHPQWMTPSDTMAKYLPFIIEEANSTADSALNNDISHGYPYDDMASVFVAITPTLFSSIYDQKEEYDAPMMCKGKSWYQDALEQFYNSSTILRCDMHNSTYNTDFIFVDGAQQVVFNSIKDTTSTPMITYGEALAFFKPSNGSSDVQKELALQPEPCPIMNETDSGDLASGCLTDPQILSTFSYQAIMDAFNDLITGMISLGNEQDLQTEVDSTTRMTSTVLAKAPELAFLQSTQTQNQDAPPSAQQRAALWTQQPFMGLTNEASNENLTLSFQEALEEVFRNITISLMSAPDLQPNTSSTYFPNKTEVHLTTLNYIYVYAADKLWLAYGLAIGATAIFVLCGLAAMFANNASYSGKFSTIFRLSRGARLDCDLQSADLSGQDPLPARVRGAMVTFRQDGMVNPDAYLLIERPDKVDQSEIAGSSEVG